MAISKRTGFVIGSDGRCLACEDGQAMVEYALILAFVAIAVVGTLSQIGPLVSDVFVSVAGGF